MPFSLRISKSIQICEYLWSLLVSDSNTEQLISGEANTSSKLSCVNAYLLHYMYLHSKREENGKCSEDRNVMFCYK